MNEKTAHFPLSLVQHDIYFDQLHHRNSPMYNIGGYIRCGALDIDRVRQAHRQVVLNHDAFGVRIVEGNVEGNVEGVVEGKTQIGQTISDIRDTDLPLLDFSDKPNPVEAAQQWLNKRFAQPLDYHNAPLCFTWLFKLSTNSYWYVGLSHHLAMDGWGFSNWAGQLESYYHGCAEHSTEPAWQQVSDKDALYLASKRYQVDKQFWAQHFNTRPNKLLPAHYQSNFNHLPQVPSKRHVVTINRDVFAQLTDLARSAKVGVPQLFLGVLASYFALVYERQTLAFGLPAHNRKNFSEKKRVGVFASISPLLLSVDPSTRFIELVQQITRLQKACLRHQQYPVGHILQQLGLSGSDASIYDISFNYLKLDYSQLAFDGINADVVYQGHNFEQVPLTVTVWDGDADHIELQLEYNLAYFNQHDAEQLGLRFEHLLLAALSEPTKPLKAMPLMPESERQTLLGFAGGAISNKPSNKPNDKPQTLIHQLFEQQVAKTPDNIALVFSQQTLSYQGLNQQANQLAHYLQAQGVSTDTLVGICLNRSIEMVVAILAVLKAGGAYVPLDPAYPAARLQFMLDDSAIKHIISQSDVMDSLALTLNDDDLNLIFVDHQQQGFEHCDNPRFGDTQSPSNLAYVMYTSGSTGMPKGVMVEHHSVTNLIASQAKTYGFAPDDVALWFSSFAFDASVEALWLVLHHGAQLVIPEQDDIVQPELFKQLVIDAKVTHLDVTPSYLLQLSGLEKQDTIRRVVAGGEAAFAQNQTTWGPRLINVYGPTEATVTALTRVGFDATVSEQCIGRPGDNMICYVLSSQQTLLPTGCVGELYIGGAGLARGYLNQPALTAERFINNPFEQGGRLYRTGDLVRYLTNGKDNGKSSSKNNGELVFVGRIDEQVNIRGLRVELGEIEYQLSLCEGVLSSVVVANEGLVAYVVGDVDTAAIKQQLQQNLPDYMVPAIFVSLDVLPLTANGKVDKTALPQPNLALLQGDIIKPVNETEQQLTNIWASLLNIDADVLSTHGNFFELGGDSILSIQLVSKAAQAGLHFGVKDLFGAPTIAALTPLVKSGAGISTGIVAPQTPVTGEQHLLPIQTDFFSDPTQIHHFNQSVLLTTPADFDGSTLSSMVRQLYQRHDALRMQFTQQPLTHSPSWTAHYLPLSDDLVAATAMIKPWPNDHFDGIETYANQIQRSLNIEQGQLFKAVYIQSPTAPGRLLLVIHHLVVDGVSWRILLQDIDALYRGQALLAKTSSYQQWGEFLKDSTPLEQEKAYWLNSLSQPVNILPTQHTGLTGRGFADFKLSQKLTEQLLSSSHQAYRTQINELLLAGVWLGINRFSDIDSIRIDLEGHGRETLFSYQDSHLGSQLDLSQTVGWFTSIYPLTLALPGVHGFAEVVNGVKDAYRAIPNKGIGFGLLPIDAAPAELLFNYLGQFDQVQGAFALATESSGDDVSPARALSHPLTLDGLVTHGQLSFRLSYDAANYQADAMQKLMDLMATALTDIVEHCLITEQGAYSCSDFAQANINTAQLQRWTADTTVEDLLPATPMQQGLLFHSLLEQGSYVTQTLLRFNGLNVGQFKRAWQQLVQRHSSFRTAFVGLDEDNAHQLVYPEVNLPWQLLDLSQLDKSAQAAQIEAIRRQDKTCNFDPKAAPLMRMILLELGLNEQGQNEHLLIWSHHHALLDGWCLPLIFAELTEYYRALQQGETALLSAQLAPLYPYRDYVLWQMAQDHNKAKVFWRELLADVEGPTPLPLANWRNDNDANNEVVESGSGEFTLQFDQNETNLLTGLAQSSRTTLYVLLQAAWALVLSRYNGDNHKVVFGSLTSGRPAQLPGADQMVGLFINTLPVVVNVDNTLSVTDYLQQLHQQQIQRDEYGYLPLSDIQQVSKVPQGLFDSLLGLENYPVDSALADNMADAGLALQGIESFEDSSYGLSIAARLTEQLTIRLVGQQKWLSQTALSQLGKHLKTVLLSFTQSSGGVLADIEMLDKTERHYLCHQLNDTAVDYPRELCIHELFEAQAEQFPNNTALEFDNTLMDYQTLNRRANQLAHYLIEQGVTPDSRVGVCIERSLEMIIAIFGILKAGGAYVPIDPHAPANRIDYLLDDADLAVVVSHDAVLNRVSRVNFDGRHIVRHIVSIQNEQLETYPQHNPLKSELGLQSSHLAYVIYTSGSTGLPKGVMVEHRALVHSITARARLYDQPKSFMMLSPVVFDSSVACIFFTLVSGGKLCISHDRLLDNPANLVRKMQQQQADFLVATPSLYNVLLDIFDTIELPHLSTVTLGGEVCTREMVDKHHQLNQRRTGRTGKVKLYNEYGPTEAAIWSTYLLLQPDEVISIGHVIDNAQLYVLDAHQQLCPTGAVGELYIGGEGLARGYINLPQLTNERFIDSSVSGSRIYKTGDLVRYLPNGHLAFVGRTDDQVKIRGFRIELGEIEDQLDQHPGVASCLVVAKEDEDGRKRLVGYITKTHPLDDDDTLMADLRQQLQSRLPDYMQPSAMMVLAQFPLTSNGKIDKKALPMPSLQGEYIAAKGDTEQALVAIWAELLGLKANTISVTANFFELGGHSLLAVRLMTEISRQWQQELVIKVIFEAPTISALARHIDAGKAVTTTLPTIPTIKAVERQKDEAVICAFAQQRLWFIDQLQGASAEYNMPAALKITGDFDVAAAEQAIDQIVARHQALRTVFVANDGKPLQRVLSDFRFTLSRDDFSALDEAERQAKIDALFAAERVKSFDLSQDLMVRATFVSIKPDEGILLFNMHHIASDGWSMDILVNEFIALYQSAENALPALPIQYADYAHWQRQWLDGVELERQLDHWQGYLNGIAPVHSLPLDLPRPPRPLLTGQCHQQIIATPLLNQLDALALQQNTTLFTLLQTVYALLLARFGDSPDIVMGTPLAGRNHALLTNMIGSFVNTSIVRSQCLPELTFEQLLQQNHQDFVAAYPVQQLPFEAIVDRLKPERNLAYNPIFQIWFVMQNQPSTELSLPGCGISLMPLPGASVQFDLELSAVVDEQQRLLLDWSFDTGLFKPSTIDYLAKGYAALLQTLVDNPASIIGELVLPDRAAFEQLIAQQTQAKIKSKVGARRFKRKPTRSSHKDN